MRFLPTSSLAALGFALFSGSASALYSNYDENNDGYLDEDEYVDYSYNAIDHDNDGSVERREWSDYSNVWYEPYDINNDISFNEADADNDGRIELSEYSDNYDSNLFEEWDQNNSGFVDDDEYEEYTSLYDDADEDGLFDF